MTTYSQLMSIRPQTAKEYFDSITDRLTTGASAEFERHYLAQLLLIERSHSAAEHARCLILEAQLNSLRDAARQIMKMAAGRLDKCEVVIVSQSIVDRLQEELNKE